MRKLLATTIAAFCISTGAMAASSTATTTGMPSDWPSDLKNAFFTDASGTKLRSQEEIRTKWTSLTAAQKTQVKADCQKVASNAGTSTETTASTKKSTTGSTAGTTTTGTAGGGQM